MSPRQRKLAVGQLVLSVDPGYATGVLTGRYLGERKFQLEFGEQFEYTQRFLLQPLVIQADWIVMEEFVLYAHEARNQIGSFFPSVHVIGAVEAFAWQAGKLERVIMQPASLRKAATKVELEHVAQLKGSRHIKDAYQHLRYFMLTEGVL
jgi:hypothetical protein